MNEPLSTPGPLTIKHRTNITGVRRDTGSIGTVANCGSHGNNEIDCDPENEANALLFRLAPELAETLRDLHDHQNGPPLSKYEKEWRATMDKAISLLKRIGY